MSALIAAVLLLHPTLAADGHLRLVAAGTGDAQVAWTLDGVEVAHSVDGQAVSVPVRAGTHDLWAEAPAPGTWRVLARPDDAGPVGAVAVPAWTAVHPADVARSSHGVPAWSMPAAAVAGSLAVLVRPRSLLQAWSRARRP